MWSKLKRPVVWIPAALVALGIPGLVLALMLGGKAGAPAQTTSVTDTPEYQSAHNSMDPAGQVHIAQGEDGTLTVSWPEGVNADSYTLQVLSGDTLLHSVTTEKTACVVPQPDATPVTLRISCEKTFLDQVRPGEQVLEVEADLSEPELTALDWSVEPETDQLTLTLEMEENALCTVFLEGEELCRTDKAQTVMELSVPERGQRLAFSYTVTRQQGQVTFESTEKPGFSLERRDFFGSELELGCQLTGDNVYTLSWNETSGEGYVVSISRDGENWEVLQTLPDDAFTYTTGHLEVFQDYFFRVEAVGGGSDGCNVTTDERAIYATVWPLMDLTLYADPQMTQTAGTAAAGSAWCVLEETGNLFGVRYGGRTCYMDSRYCMINLPEYIGDLCAYDITNSYASIYTVHEYGIEDVTGTVIRGYEDIQVGQEQYLVPLIYPAAKKLISAAHTAREYGYRFKLYDSFRPREATLSIYDLTSLILDHEVPDETYSGKAVDDLDELSWEPELVPASQAAMALYTQATAEATEQTQTTTEATEVPAETTEATEAPTESTEVTEAPTEATTEATEDTVPMEPEKLTYEILMTDDGRYLLGNFLAVGISNHNLGIAMDMTLEALDGQAVEMQTSIHDLSWYSEVARNNANAKLLRRIMTEAGFGALKSEWWHFQDEQARDELGLKNLYYGVSGACWIKNDTGWRYRTADGDYLTDCTETLNGESYTFDKNGYVTQ